MVMEYLKKLLIAAVIGNLSFLTDVIANSNVTPVGRYLSTSNKPKQAQLDLLSQSIQMRFPQTVKTVGDAMRYILFYSGYSLIPEEKMSVALKTIMSKPLPAIDREIGPVSLKDALKVLAGPAFYIKQDVISRTINFGLKPDLKRITQ